MKSRRFFLILLLFVSVDFAVPYEPTARGWQDFEDEEEAVHPEVRRAERPRISAEARSAGAAVTHEARPASTAGRQPSRQPREPVTRLARADTSSPPAASPEAH